MILIGVDADGGDNGSSVVAEGIEIALEKLSDLKIMVFSVDDLSYLTRKYPGKVSYIPSEEVVTMTDSPTAFRKKPGSSLVMACQNEDVQGTFTIANSGTAYMAAIGYVKRIKGVRPALASVIPGRRESILLDIGANVKCEPRDFPQFAAMGAAYAEIVLGRLNPTIGLLNIGEEEAKGNEFVNEVYELMREVPGFYGNVQGGDVPKGKTDVTIADGFLGNVQLKAMEGTAEMIFEAIRDDLNSSWFAKLAALPVKRRLKRLALSRSRDLYGGAPLLGVRKPFLIGHGSSTPLGVANGIRIAVDCVLQNLPAEIEKRLPS